MKNQIAVIDLLTAAESLVCDDTVGIRPIPDGDESATAASQSKYVDKFVDPAQVGGRG